MSDDDDGIFISETRFFSSPEEMRAALLCDGVMFWSEAKERELKERQANVEDATAILEAAKRYRSDG